MKKVLTSILMIIMCLIVVSPTVLASQSPVDVAKQEKQNIDKQYNPKGMIVTTEDGQILYNYHDKKQVDPASTTKLMTMNLIYDDIKSGKVKMNDKVKITSRYEKMSELPNLTTFPLKQGETVTINQLLKQAALESSNASTLVLAEHIDGNSSKFTDRMNKKAKELGMKNTKFTNPSGANNKVLQPYEPKKYKNDTISHTSARDMAILSTNLLKEHPDVLKITKLSKDTQSNQELHNTNTSLPNAADAMKDVDGLKTGTSDNGYNLELTAKRHHLRIVTGIFNVMPYPDEQAKHARQKLANALTEHAFKQYEYRKVVSKGEHKIDGKEYEVKKDLYDLVPKDKKKYKLKVSKDNRLYVDYDRQFIKDHHAPSVKVEATTHWGMIFLYILMAVVGLVLLGMLTIIGIKIYFKNNK
ncbi:penicillin-binding protein PBP4 [Staphylococcus pasteuri]|uniref:penicillin-binding protein PBP4 n=1 Tax=Staphylococcus pasteuri TaxID=45972 RepID=UPI000E3AE6C4|nr:penicillin-binding protein PBP4 [Staphylococcus pasteuri]RFD66995.1 penicillin-binding protein [Staphylococcus pasteuri]